MKGRIDEDEHIIIEEEHIIDDNHGNTSVNLNESSIIANNFLQLSHFGGSNNKCIQNTLYGGDDFYSILTSNTNRRSRRPRRNVRFDLDINDPVIKMQREETFKLRNQITEDVKDAVRYFRQVKKDEHQLEEELEQELRIKKYREEMKALWLKRNRIQEAVQLHKAIRIYKRSDNKVFIRWSAIISTRKNK